ncbi:MAG: biotin/lipoyl-binding protein, partial [Xanthomonadales bacterium]|nr:biotin/lipoyl-binding protein [Xanthomonadales bacterium]
MYAACSASKTATRSARCMARRSKRRRRCCRATISRRSSAKCWRATMPRPTRSAASARIAPAPTAKPHATHPIQNFPGRVKTMAEIEVKVPDIGGHDGVPVIELLVKPGDTVAKDQGLVTLESDKATMEVPSSAAGVVKALKVKLNDAVSTGDVIAIIESDAAASAPAPNPAPAVA